MAFQNLLNLYGLDVDVFDVISKLPSLQATESREPEMFLMPFPRRKTLGSKNRSSNVVYLRPIMNRCK
jgi:hypothetical protein